MITATEAGCVLPGTAVLEQLCSELLADDVAAPCHAIVQRMLTGTATRA